MSLILHPDTFLRQETHEVNFPLSEEVDAIIGEMIEEMYHHNGIGLAANQIGYNRRIFIMDPTASKSNPLIFINPKVESKNNIKISEQEGCLSCPGKYLKVKRSVSINLSWYNKEGEEQYKTFYYLPGRIVQHEMDHLNGKLIIDTGKE